MKKIILAGAAALLLSTAAFAEDAGKGDQGAVAASTSVSYGTQQAASDYLASKIIGLDVYNSEKAEIGSISDLVVDAPGKVTYAVIGVGGFLGMGEKYVAVPVTSIDITRDGSSLKASMSATKEELKSAPEYKYYKASN